MDGAPALARRPGDVAAADGSTSRARSPRAFGFRPLAETVRGTLDERETTDAPGSAPEREAELLAAWRARKDTRGRARLAIASAAN